MPNAGTPFARRTRSRGVSATQAGCTSKSVWQGQSKRWFLKYRIAGVEKQLALGSYPDVTLTAARKARDTAKLQKSQGADPVMLRKVEKLKASRTDGDTFKNVALEWYGKQSPQWSDSHAERSLRQLERDLFPRIGDRPMVDIHPMELLAVL